MQKDKIRITNPEAAQALRTSSVLGYFLNSANPSDVAKKSGLAANLVHHHAKKALGLGLLLEHRREKNKVFYQLAARTFTYPRGLLPVEQQEVADMKLLSAAFLTAYERSDALVASEDPDYHVHGFADKFTPNPKIEPHVPNTLEKHPAHFYSRTLSLSQERYQQLVQQITQLLEQTQSEKSADSGSCTIAVLGFDGVWHEGNQDSGHINSFVPLLPVPKTN
jgi:DNA-binding transcriptional ArsR family regulator